MPYEYAPNYPYSNTGRVGLSTTDHIFAPLTTLSFLAGQVSTPRLGISVLIMPYRNPISTAKMLVTLDVLSSGRVILGAGVKCNRRPGGHAILARCLQCHHAACLPCSTGHNGHTTARRRLQ
jgi:hypothetical protein